MRLVRRRNPPPSLRADHADYRPELREDFEYSCAYCSIMEVEASTISFEIDHYDPVSNGGAKADYYNLMYGCVHCNGSRGKSDWIPKPDPANQPDLHLLRPDEDDFDHHLFVDQDQLKEKSSSGRYTRIALRLNRDQVLRLRRIRREAHAADEYIANGLRGLSVMNPDELPQPWRHRLRELQKSGVTVPSTERSLAELFAKSPMASDDPDLDKALNAERRVLQQELETKAGEPVRGGARKAQREKK
jgi:hypothetical protein